MAQLPLHALVILTLISVTTVTVRGDAGFEGYQDSRLPGRPFTFEDMTYRMPMMPSGSPQATLLPHFLNMASLVAKIFLKLTLFKMIVKFVALVCLFLFIPKLKLSAMGRENVEIDSAKLESVAQLVRKAIEKYST